MSAASGRPKVSGIALGRQQSHDHGNSGGREEFSFTQFTISPGRSPIIETTSGYIDV
jgi:hypothetical protein